MTKILLLLGCFWTSQQIFSQALKEAPTSTSPHLVLKREMSLAEFDSLMKEEERKKPQVNFVPAINKFDVKMVSPDGKYVVAYNINHLYTDKLYFFNIKGVLLSTHEIGFSPTIKYSYSGNYIEIFNGVGREFYVFSKEGNIIHKGDYLDITHSKGEFITNFLYLEDVDNFLFSTNKYSYININLSAYKIEGYSSIGYYDLFTKKLILNKINFIEKSMDIISLDIQTGVNTNLKSGVDNFHIQSNKLFVIKNNKVSTYEIK